MRRPLVVKLGSSLVVDQRGRPRRAVLRDLAAEIAELIGSGTPVCVVSSGAIALGLRRLGLERRPTSLPRLQAASALGQAALQRAWQDAFRPFRVETAQILLTSAEIGDRRAYVNVRNALHALFSLGAVPIINENDATATDEISFGDNDSLAAQVAVLSKARLLLLLTSVPGVLAEGKVVEDGAAAHLAEFAPAGPLGRGGMASKVAAADLAAAAGIPTVIADGAAPGIVARALSGAGAGTRFAAEEEEELSAFKLWLRHGRRIAGQIHVDAGARRAIVSHGASLLAVGVTGSEGAFQAGDGVELVGPDGTVFARGIASAADTELVGKPADVEAVHRDRLVLVHERTEAQARPRSIPSQ